MSLNYILYALFTQTSVVNGCPNNAVKVYHLLEELNLLRVFISLYKQERFGQSMLLLDYTTPGFYYCV